MFRLIKLAMYALVGYVLYELYQGMTAQTPGGDSARGGGRRAGNESQARGGAALTGEGRGKRMQTLDSNGGSAPHRVGRGVTAS